MTSSLKESSIDALKHLRHQSHLLERSPSHLIQHEPRLYQAHQLADCPWPQTSEGQYARTFLTPLIQQGTSHYIENVHTDLCVCILEDIVLPVTINEAEYDNSYVCSPYSYFISYAKQSLDFLPNTWLYHPMHVLLRGLGSVFQKLHLNKVVSVNNWLYSTNLYPPLQSEQLLKIVQALQHSFPEHTIVFRSIDPCTNPTSYHALQQMGFDYIATRQIFFINPHQSPLFESRLFKSDVKLLKNSQYEVLDGQQIKEEEIPRLLELYHTLYIGKYSTLNPQFNANFLRLMLKQNLMHFKVLKKGGRIDGVVGYVERNGKMYCPFFGYDRQVPKEASLYRLLSTVLMLEAHERHLLFHQSSGASMFKKIRKGQECIEYTAVFYKHLPVKRQVPWRMLKTLYNSIGKFYMKRY